MPHKHNAAVHHHFVKPKSRKRDWSQYNRQLVKRGDISIWMTDDVVESWYQSSIRHCTHVDRVNSPKLKSKVGGD